MVYNNISLNNNKSSDDEYYEEIVDEDDYIDEIILDDVDDGGESDYTEVTLEDDEVGAGSMQAANGRLSPEERLSELQPKCIVDLQSSLQRLDTKNQMASHSNDVEDTRIAVSAAKLKEKEENARLKAKVAARREAAKRLLAEANSALRNNDAPPPMAQASTRAPAEIHEEVKAEPATADDESSAFNSIAHLKKQSVSSFLHKNEAPPYTAQISTTKAQACMSEIAKAETRNSIEESSEGEFYSIDQLKKQSVPGLDYKNREKYLSDTDFQNAFGCTKAEWTGMPGWKKTKAKRSLGLF
jgi:hypothetical protein